ncbi:acyl-CoA dehydrogenase family protein [Candidatus Poriferisodalis sp.]|uniref:acyl-CoA dehydrogenase family protein n=1 Tax=Candidatus Poriferisodalis sp. TaxID=3101277 RepID=UPI003D0BDD87
MPDFLDARHQRWLEVAEQLAPELVTLADHAGADGDSELAGAVREASKAAGVFAMTQPAAFGGTEAGALALCIVRDTLARHGVGHLGGVFGPSPGVLAQVGEPLRSRFLLPYLAGDLRGGFGFTEPSDAPRPTWARRDGDELVVNGQKSYVTGGAEADFINALVEVEGAGPAMVLIETNRGGVTLTQRFATLDGSHHAAFTFADVRLPATHVIGEAGRGMGRALAQISATRMAIAADCVGQCRFALQLVADTLAARAARHALEDHPNAVGTAPERITLGNMRIAAYAARSALYRTARLVDADENAVNEVMAAKSLATETLSRVCDDAIGLVGGTALIDGHPLADMLRRVRAMRLAEGPTEVLAANVSRGHLDLGLGRI